MGTFLFSEVVLVKKLTLRNLKHAQDATQRETVNPVSAVVAKDALLLQDRSMNRAHFQGRFRKTAFGDFKGRPGRLPEMEEAALADVAFNAEKASAAIAAAAVVDAAAQDGVVIEDASITG